MTAVASLEAVPALDEAGAAVLLVDDNAGKRLAVQAMLSPLGHDGRRADSGRAALRAVVDHDFAVGFRSSGWPRSSRCRITSDGTAAATPPAWRARRSRSPGASWPSPTCSMRSPLGLDPSPLLAE